MQNGYEVVKQVFEKIMPIKYCENKVEPALVSNSGFGDKFH